MLIGVLLFVAATVAFANLVADLLAGVSIRAARRGRAPAQSSRGYAEDVSHCAQAFSK